MAHRDISPQNSDPYSEPDSESPARLVEPWPWGGAWVPLPDGTVLRLLDVTARGRTWWWRTFPGGGVAQRGRLSAEA